MNSFDILRTEHMSIEDAQLFFIRFVSFSNCERNMMPPKGVVLLQDRYLFYSLFYKNSRLMSISKKFYDHPLSPYMEMQRTNIGLDELKDNENT